MSLFCNVMWTLLGQLQGLKALQSDQGSAGFLKGFPGSPKKRNLSSNVAKSKIIISGGRLFFSTKTPTECLKKILSHQAKVNHLMAQETRYVEDALIFSPSQGPRCLSEK